MTDDHADPQRHSRAELLRRAAGVAIGIAALRGGVGPLLGDASARAAAAPAVRVVSRDEPVPGRRPALSAAEPLAAPRFTLAGVHWQGSGTVWLRTRSVSGAWSAWYRAVVHELADPGTEGVGQDWHLGTPIWTDLSDAIEYRAAGRITRLRAHFVLSEPRPGRTLARAVQPPILLRDAWGADESIVQGPPSYASRLSLAVVHHTAGSTPKTPEGSAAVVRGIQAYHVKSNDWNDIGYNYLVDPFGQVFEGRAGGIDRNVIGAHALGFNTGSAGVAVLGNLDTKLLTPEARAALVGLLAWRLDLGHVDPSSLVGYTSGGRSLTLRAVSGHRDVNSTACPGANLYPELDAIAADAALLGRPKLYEPAVEPSPKGGVRFRARLSEPLPWSIAVTSATGEVAHRSGSGSVIDWSWRAESIAPGTYGYAIASTDDVLPATGSFTLGDGVEPPGEPPPRPARPSGVPRRIPRWAWELRRWHLTAKASRGPRPVGAPRPLPAWYWPWFAWQSALKRWNEQYGST